MAQFPAKVTTAIRPGTVFVPMHWGTLWADQAEANELTHAIACPISHEPELKACAVQIRVVRSRFKILILSNPVMGIGSFIGRMQT